MGNFGILYKIENRNLCKTHFFHTLFHNLWKTPWKVHRSLATAVEKRLTDRHFSTGDRLGEKSASLDLLDHFLHFGAENGVLHHALFHGIQGGEDGGVVSFNELTDVGQGHIRDLTDDVDRDVAGVGDLLGALGADDLRGTASVWSD